MDSSSAIALIFLCLSFVLLTHQLPSDIASAVSNGTASPSDVTTAVNNGTTPSSNITVVPASCTNGQGMAGGCVERTYCNYNTSHIDLTLYGPPGYQDPCPGDGLCCPTEFILPKTQKPASDDDSDSKEDE